MRKNRLCQASIMGHTNHALAIPAANSPQSGRGSTALNECSIHSRLLRECRVPESTSSAPRPRCRSASRSVGVVVVARANSGAAPTIPEFGEHGWRPTSITPIPTYRPTRRHFSLSSCIFMSYTPHTRHGAVNTRPVGGHLAKIRHRIHLK